MLRSTHSDTFFNSLLTRRRGARCKREQLRRYITRPALADERVQFNAAGQVELKLKTPWRDGTTHLVMSAGGHAAPNRVAA